MSEPIYVYQKGKGWVPVTTRTPDEILNGYTCGKSIERGTRRCTTCGCAYSSHAGDSCDYPYDGREWTD